jgi:hypothetical protein
VVQSQASSTMVEMKNTEGNMKVFTAPTGPVACVGDCKWYCCCWCCCCCHSSTKLRPGSRK